MALPSILAINGGSSSLKFALFKVEKNLHLILDGEIERIGLLNSSLRIGNTKKPIAAQDHPMALQILLDWISSQQELHNIAAVGHRIVHGGPRYHHPERITQEVIKELKNLVPFAPEHLPQEIALIEILQHYFKNIPQIACFDTAFHHNLPRVAQILPLPRRYEAQGVRRYGFHGLSYAFLMEELERLTGPEKAQGRTILAHLGNGASLAAVYNGTCIDTSMSLTPTAGIPMSCRSGDVDPGLAAYLGLDGKQFMHMATHHAGLLGVSETSSDMSELLAKEKQDVRAAEAISLFCYQVKKMVGAYTAALGGLDTLIFTAGIGENSPTIRSRICNKLNSIGIELDEEKNSTNAPLISIENIPVAVRVIHTDESLMVAKMTCKKINLF